MHKIPKIYSLVDPITNEVRYVGKSCNVDARYKAHLTMCYNNTKKECWIKSLKAKGLLPLLEILETSTEADWQKCERKWIKFYKEKGNKLVNGTDGGDGGKIDDEIMKKVALNRVGKKLIKHKDQNSNRGVKLTKEHVAAMTAGRTPGKKRPDVDNYEKYAKIRAKKVSQFTLDGVFIRSWDRLIQVTRELGIGHGSISNACSGRAKTAGGYKWKYD